MVRGQRRSGREQQFEDAEETLRTILRTAQQLFMEFGYRAVTTRQIAGACGLTQPALYHYFHDKQELYVAMMHEEVAKMRAALERMARRGESVAERLQRIVVYLLNSGQHDLDIMLHDIRHELSAEARATLASIFRTGIVAPIASVFAAGIEEGLLRDREHGGVDAITAAYLLLSMIARQPGARPDERAPGEDAAQQSHSILFADDEQRASMIVRVLLHGLAYPDREVEDTRQSKTDS